MSPEFPVIEPAVLDQVSGGGAGAADCNILADAHYDQAAKKIFSPKSPSLGTPSPGPTTAAGRHAAEQAAWDDSRAKAAVCDAALSADLAKGVPIGHLDLRSYFPK